MYNRRVTKSETVLIAAHDKGYRVVSGKVYSHKNNILKLSKCTNGYYRFSIHFDGQREIVFVHRLVAYQKYKEKLFENGIVVRHLNGDCVDNSEENISIGTESQNMLDRTPADRLVHSINAAKNKRKLTDTEIAEARRLRKEGWTYFRLMEKFGITSKGTMHHILNNNYKTKA